MKKNIKIFMILVLFLSFSSCKKKENKIPEEEAINNKINELVKVDINSNTDYTNPVSPFYILGIHTIVNPDITYPDDENNVTDIKDIPKPKTNSEDNVGPEVYYDPSYHRAVINMSTELLVELRYTGDENNKPTKIELRNIKILDEPSFGKLNFFAIDEGTEKDYLYKMRNHKITNSYTYNTDLMGNKLEKGSLNLRFSTAIDDIYTSTVKSILKKKFTELLKEKSITSNSLRYKIGFEILIYTKNNVYALPFIYEFKDLNLSLESVFRVNNYKNPLYLIKVK